MNDIEIVEGRLFKHYSIISDASRLTLRQINKFLAFKPLPKFSACTTIDNFEEALFGSGGRLSYAFEEYDEEVPGKMRLSAYQFSPVYAGRITLRERFWKEKVKTEKESAIIRLNNIANEYLQEVESSRIRGYVAGQTRGVFTGARQAIDRMVEYSKGNQAVKYGPGLIEDIEKWLEGAEASTSGAVEVAEDLILYIVERFTERMTEATRFKSALGNSSDPL